MNIKQYVCYICVWMLAYVWNRHARYKSIVASETQFDTETNEKKIQHVNVVKQCFVCAATIESNWIGIAYLIGNIWFDTSVIQHLM